MPSPNSPKHPMSEAGADAAWLAWLEPDGLVFQVPHVLLTLHIVIFG